MARTLPPRRRSGRRVPRRVMRASCVFAALAPGRPSLPVLDSPCYERAAMADLVALYRHAVRARLLDERLTVLSKAGRIGYHPDALRAELVVVAATAALAETDWVFPTPRDHAAALVRGATSQSYLDHVVGNADDILRGHGTPGAAGIHQGARRSRMSPSCDALARDRMNLSLIHISEPTRPY